MPHRQDFKGNFQAPSLPSPDEFQQGKGEAGWKWKSQGISCGKCKCDKPRQQQNHCRQRHSLRTGSRLASFFQVGGKCYASVAGLPEVQKSAFTGGSRRRSDIIPTTWSLLLFLACWHGKQNPAVISIDVSYHLKPVNEAGVFRLGSGLGRDPCTPAYREREASLHPHLENDILSGV